MKAMNLSNILIQVTKKTTVFQMITLSADYVVDHLKSNIQKAKNTLKCLLEGFMKGTGLNRSRKVVLEIRSIKNWKRSLKEAICDFQRTRSIKDTTKGFLSKSENLEEDIAGLFIIGTF